MTTTLIETCCSPSHGNPKDSAARRLDRLSRCAFALIAAMVASHQWILQPALSALTSDAPAINVAGRQRMLSQRLTKAALAMQMAGDDHPEERATWRNELETTLQEWQHAHQKIRAGSVINAARRGSPDSLKETFDELEPHFQAISRAAETLIGESDAAEQNEAVARLLRHEADFLTRMHSIVGIFETDARSHVRKLQLMGMSITVMTLLALLALQLFVVRPAVTIVGSKMASSEAKYEQLVESMTDGLIAVDQTGKIRFANQRFGLLLGLTNDEVTGAALADLVAAPDQAQFATLLGQADGELTPTEFQFRHVSGRVIETRVAPQRRLDRSDGSERWVLIVTDVTADKAVERRSRELLEQLAHADRLISIGTMAAALAHEINQPLGAIANYAEGCLKRMSSSEIKPAEMMIPLRGILRATHRSAEIIRRTREFARRRPHQVSKESINDLVREVDELCRPEARRRCVHVELELDPLDPKAEVDGIQIQQVLTNLLQNAFVALEHRPQECRRVRISIEQNGLDEIEVSVSDSGPGIPAEGATAWFEPFMTTREQGTGMGLAIARSIVELHGGRIWAEANQDGGALFRFVIPRDQPLALTSAVDPSSTGEAAAELLEVG